MPLIKPGIPTKVTFGITTEGERVATPYEVNAYPLVVSCGIQEKTLHLSRLPDGIIIDSVNIEERVAQVVSSSKIQIRDISYDSVSGYVYVMFQVNDDRSLRLIRIADVATRKDLDSQSAAIVIPSADRNSTCLAIHDNVMHTLLGSVDEGASGAKTFTTRAYDLEPTQIRRNATKDISFKNKAGNSDPISYLEIFEGNILAWCEGVGTENTFSRVQGDNLTPVESREGIELLHPFARVQDNVHVSKYSGQSLTGDITTFSPTDGIYCRTNAYERQDVSGIRPYIGVGIDTVLTRTTDDLDDLVFVVMQDLQVTPHITEVDIGIGVVNDYTITYDAFIRMRTANGILTAAHWQTVGSQRFFWPSIRSDSNSALFERAALVDNPTAVTGGDGSGSEIVDDVDNPEVILVLNTIQSVQSLETRDGDDNIYAVVPRDRTATFYSRRIPEFAIVNPGNVRFIHDGFIYTIDNLNCNADEDGQPIYTINCSFAPVTE